MNTRVLLHLCAWLIAPGLTLLRAADPTAAFEQANKLYEQGQFPAAAAAYENLLRSGRSSAAIYFNLGNACFKSGQVRKAIVNYRLAERMAPRDPAISANLQFARSAVQGNTTRSLRLWQRWSRQLTLNEWTLLTTACVWLGVALQVAGQFKPALRGQFRRSTLVALIGGSVCASGLISACVEQFVNIPAVVSAREPILHHGPLDESPSVQTLRDGQELRVLDRKDDWLQVSGASRGIGWIRRDQVILLQP